MTSTRKPQGGPSLEAIANDLVIAACNWLGTKAAAYVASRRASTRVAPAPGQPSPRPSQQPSPQPSRGESSPSRGKPAWAALWSGRAPTPSRTAPAPTQAEARRHDRARRIQARLQASSRTRLIVACLCGAYGLLAGRAALLMLGADVRLQERVRIQYQTPVEVEGRRGDLVDRNGNLMATTVAMPTLHVDPSLLDEQGIHDLAAGLAPILGTSREAMEKRFENRARRDVVLARSIRPDLALRALALPQRPALWLSEDSRRYYPNGRMASSLLGVVGRDGHGLAGLEYTLDQQVKGEIHRYVEVRDRKGRGIRPGASEQRLAYAGHNVTLTIDQFIQLAAEKGLDEIMAASAPEAAFAVVVDVRTGEILAMANRPDVDLNDTKGLDLEKMKNKAVVDQFEPGSVFKPFIVAMAMEEGLVTPESLVNCEGGRWSVGRKTISDDHPHGTITLTEVIKYSSNIGAAKMGLRLGGNRVVPGLQAFGYGKVPGTGLLGEVPGIIRSAKTIKPIELATTSYGHGVTASALQLAEGIATLANGGLRMQPYLVREVRDQWGQVIQVNEPQPLKQAISQETANRISRMMVTVTEEGGTATRARVPGYQVAGKTGTAWKVVNGAYSSTARMASFIGFLPADNPRVAIAVVVDTPTQGSRYGGIAAAPAFAHIGADIMRYLAIPPNPALMDKPGASVPVVENEDRPLVQAGHDFWSAPGSPTPVTELHWAPEDRLVIPDVRGLSMRDVLALFQGSGLEVAVSGVGEAFDQFPAPGNTVAMGQRVEVKFQ